MTHRLDQFAPFLLSILTVVIFFVAGFFPDGRLWGINFWGYFPTFVPVTLFVLSVIIIVAVYFGFINQSPKTVAPDPAKIKWNVHLAGCFIFALAMVLVLWFFRSETHFTGDGYHILAQMASDNAQIKSTEIGETWLHIGVMKIFGDGSKQTALFTYQLLSVIAGFLFFLSVSIISYFLFSNRIRQVLFSLGLATGGFVLLFFGHVEHYSWMIMTVTVMNLTSILAVRQKLSKWIPFVLLLVAISLHVVAVVFTPAILYLLLRKSPFSRRNPRAVQIVLTGVSLVAFGAFIFLYNTNYFFRYAFVPIFPHEVTAGGYTLFSASHLLDFINLLTLLLPSLLLFLWLIFYGSSKVLVKTPEYRFLGLAVLSCGVFLFILDPKLGMPRDWDLFSVIGVPLVIWQFLWALDNRLVTQKGIIVALLSIVLGWTVLIPRVAEQIIPLVAISHLNNYMSFDVAKNRSSGQLLFEYYKKIGDVQAAGEEEKRWYRDYPEMKLVYESLKYFNSGDIDKAIRLNEEALKINPIFWNAYSNLGGGLLLKKLNDSALKILKIADGLNPGNTTTMSKLANALYENGKTREAEKQLMEALKLDSSLTEALVYLAWIYRNENRQEECIEMLNRMSHHDDAPVDALVLLMEYYLDHYDYQNAAVILRNKSVQNLDNSYFQTLFQKYPEFKKFLTQ